MFQRKTNEDDIYKNDKPQSIINGESVIARRKDLLYEDKLKHLNRWVAFVKTVLQCKN